MILYQFFKNYMRIALYFFYKNILVYGKENIPKNGAVLFVSNHKNALIDPLIITVNTKRKLYFLSRASAFKIKPIAWFLSNLNMIPIYRIRDGKNTISKNEIVFKKCYDILNKNKSILIFPEGTHEIKRMVTPLKKGFARIVIGTLEKYPNLQLQILPIGLNYTDATLFGESTSIYYGKPILANDFIDKNNPTISIENLVTVVNEKLKGLTTNIKSEVYDSVINQLGNIDYLNPKKVNAAVENLSNYQSDKTIKKEQSLLWKGLKAIVSINSFIPLLIYKQFVSKIKEIEFVSTTKFGIGITAFPLFYILQSLVINHFFNLNFTIIYLLISILFVLILSKSKR